jgi:hypothetical protein
LTRRAAKPILGKALSQRNSLNVEGWLMTRKVIHVALNGVTGRMGYRQHLVRSLLALREQGGLPLDDGTLLYPEPVLVGRRAARPVPLDHEPG